MTIRIFTLGLFALLCFTVGGIAAPHLSFAADDGAQAAPAQSQTQPDHPRMGDGGFREKMKERRANGQAGQGQGGQGQGAIDPSKRQQLREELMKLPPEERKAKIEALKQQMSEGRAQKLEERKAQFQDKWDKASPEQRTKFCTNVQQKCASGEQGAQFACNVAKTKCEGQ